MKASFVNYSVLPEVKTLEALIHEPDLKRIVCQHSRAVETVSTCPFQIQIVGFQGGELHPPANEPTPFAHAVWTEGKERPEVNKGW